MNRTIEEWVARYNKKVPQGFRRDERFAFFYFPDKGFCELTATDKMVIMGQVSGDGRFWKNFAEKMAQHLNLRVCGTFCSRKEVLAWLRLFGYKVIKLEEKGGFKRYHCESKTGGWCLMTECLFENGYRAHYTTWEVQESEN